ncbi:MAG: 23S rRNA (pseudouridine(1915)-N(3))-methyltransferase RlmH [Proteobacteria bacterium]|nr:23S rRNA (pseudouridine(1915)-N(3))-methyltransferase RlmH [Pseudomonadota bacterium]
MRKIRIYCIGKNQEAYLKQGLAVFEKKLRRYCDFQLQCVKEADYASGTKKRWLVEEGRRLLKHDHPNSFSVVCDEKGKSFTSLEFSKEFGKWANRGFSQFDFFIGGPFGLSDEVKNSADLLLGISPMTMTHQIVRLVLIEQIYRSFTIIHNEKYHNP